MASSCIPAWTVKKRDGSFCQFNREKIVSAVQRCIAAAKYTTVSEYFPQSVTEAVVLSLGSRIVEKTIHVEQLQDLVETTLLQFNQHMLARDYIVYRQMRANLRKEEGAMYDLSKIPDDVVTPWGPLGFVTFKRTYARERGDGDSESFRDTVLRVLDACQTQLKVGFSNGELHECYRFMMQLKGVVSGRFLWQLGTGTVQRFGLMSLQNCAFVKIDTPAAFLWVFDVLMLGTGVGVSVENKNVVLLPPVVRGPPSSQSKRFLRVVC
jgi:hypothetical protein